MAIAIATIFAYGFYWEMAHEFQISFPRKDGDPLIWVRFIFLRNPFQGRQKMVHFKRGQVPIEKRRVYGRKEAQ